MRIKNIIINCEVTSLLICHQLLRTSIKRNVWHAVRRINISIQERKDLLFKTVTVIGVYCGGGVICTNEHDFREWHFTQKQ